MQHGLELGCGAESHTSRGASWDMQGVTPGLSPFTKPDESMSVLKNACDSQARRTSGNRAFGCSLTAYSILSAAMTSVGV
jgi:hypothetical protein